MLIWKGCRSSISIMYVCVCVFHVGVKDIMIGDGTCDVDIGLLVGC